LPQNCEIPLLLLYMTFRVSCIVIYCYNRTNEKHLLTPWCIVLLEKLIGLQLVKKFLAFHGTPRFITALTGVRHLSLCWAHPIQSIYPHPTSSRSILILSTHLQRETLISQIYFWNMTLHVSDSISVHQQESSTVHTAIGTGHNDI